MRSNRNDPSRYCGTIAKYDRQTGERVLLELGNGRLPGEAVFVPAETGAAEDDGYLMTYVFNAATNASELAVFDAATMSPDPVATVHLPRVPFGFHDNWGPATVVD
jgi:carotenoid cleavage dioxygenase